MDRFNQLIKQPEVALDLAVWLEKHGEAFYRQAIAAAEDETARTLFTWLAAEERGHGETYKALYEKIAGEKVRQETLVGEYGHFINMLIEEVTADLEFGAGDSLETILQKALAFEQKTLAYFREIRERFPGESGAMIEAICAEEAKHIDILKKALSP